MVCRIKGPKSRRSRIYLTWKDVRNLVEPSIGLGGLGRRYGLADEMGKGLFPHSSNSSLWYVRSAKSGAINLGITLDLYSGN